MIVLRDERQRLDVARCKPNKGLAGFKFQIDLVAHKAAQPIDLFRVINCNANARIAAATCGVNLGMQYERTSGQWHSRPREHPTRKVTCHGRRPVPGVVAAAPGPAPADASAATSGSGRKSTILKPSGFQLRVCGFFEGSEYPY